jgi:phosphatidylglycerophosphate synthase
MAPFFRLPEAPLRRRALGAVALGLTAAIAGALAARAALPLGGSYAIKSAGLYLAIMAVAIGRLHASHPLPQFGAANQVTTARAVVVAWLSGLVGEPALPDFALAAALAGLAAMALDGVDGWLARRRGTATAFGARFDMEVDALLIATLAVLAWQAGKTGPWILLIGLMRYVFVAAGQLRPWLRAPLPPSRRRQTIAVVQMAGLIVVLWPAVAPPIAGAVAATALAALVCSFLVDIRWLHQRRGASRTPVPPPATGNNRRGWVALAAALVLLNASLTFENVWPTPAIRWSGQVSPELVVLLLGLLAASRLLGRRDRALAGWLGGAWLLLILGRYADVTAPALYGRDVNLYWDLPHVSNVAAMLAQAAPAWLVLLAIAGAGLTVFAFHTLVRWSLTRVLGAMAVARERAVVGTLAVVAAALLAGQHLSATPAGLHAFSTAVTGSYARQLRLAREAMAGTRPLGLSPPMDADLALVKGADVLLIFVESYGAVAFDRPEFVHRLADSRAALTDAVRATGRDVVSAFVDSPTFGGASWLAHLSLLSGVEVRDPDSYALLMTEKRRTLVTSFAQRGYRTVALMPGLWQAWPEGAFYGFEEIYGGNRLDDQGPSFGWWAIPDQYALAKLDALELAGASRRPIFAFFPTVSTHTPFSPTPPYQPDWRRILTAEPFEEADLDRVWEQWPDWMNLGPSYADALEYSYRSLAGYLRSRPDSDLVLVLVGDHQPPAAVTGEGAPWDVPVHVITGRRVLLENLTGRGFRPGLEPSRPVLGAMPALAQLLLAAFSAGE